jgi:hypothetical protein
VHRLETLLDYIIINGTWTAENDRSIIQDAFSGFELTTNNATIAELTGPINFSAKDLTGTQFLTNICQVSGGEWRVQEDKAISYRLEGSVSAPFGFSNVPNSPDDTGQIS